MKARYKFLLLAILVIAQFSCTKEKPDSKKVAIVNQTQDEKIKEETPVQLEKKEAVKQKVSVVPFFKSVSEKHRKPDQKFIVKTTEKKQIVCSQGTRLTIPADAFIEKETGKAVAGDVNLSVKEYYSLADNLLAGLTTQSDDKLIETGGMLFIEATANGKKLDLKVGKTILAEFPGSETKQGMRIFKGEKDDKGKINWKVTKLPKLSRKPEPSMTYKTRVKIYQVVMGKVESQPIINFEKVSGENVKGNLLCSVKNIRDCYSLIEFNILKSSDSTKNGIFQRFLSPNFLGYWKSNIPIKNNEEVSVEIRSRAFKDYETNNVVYSKFDLEIENLGWINCDRFINNSAPRIAYKIDGNPFEMRAIIVFDKYKSMMEAVHTSKGVQFSNVPKGEKVTLLVYKIVNDEIYFAKAETVIGAENKPALNYKPVNAQQVESEMKSMKWS